MMTDAEAEAARSAPVGPDWAKPPSWAARGRADLAERRRVSIEAAIRLVRGRALLRTLPR